MLDPALTSVNDPKIPMDHQKLAKTLLRIMSIWLLAQSLTQLSSGFYTTIQLVGHSAWTGYKWGTVFPGCITLSISLILFYTSKRLAKMVTADYAEAKA